MNSVRYFEVSDEISRLEPLDSPSGWIGESNGGQFVMPLQRLLHHQGDTFDLAELGILPLGPGTVLYTRTFQATLVERDDQLELRRGSTQPIQLCGLPGQLTDAVLSEDGNLLLCESELWENSDIPTEYLILFETQTGKQLFQSKVQTLKGWLFDWSNTVKSFVVYHEEERSLGYLGQDGSYRAVDLPNGLEGAVLEDFVVHRGQPLICAHFLDEHQANLLIGELSTEAIRWRDPIPLGEVERGWFTWHPHREWLLIVRTDDTRAYLDLIDSNGRDLGSVSLYTDWETEAVAWSGDGTMVAAVCEEHLALWDVSELLGEQKGPGGDLSPFLELPD